jgi:hypothetical protein
MREYLLWQRRRGGSSGSGSGTGAAAAAASAQRHSGTTVAVGGPLIILAKKNLLQMTFLELYHVYIYYVTSHI